MVPRDHGARLTAGLHVRRESAAAAPPLKSWPIDGAGICVGCGGIVVLELGRLRCTRCGQTWGYSSSPSIATPTA